MVQIDTMKPTAQLARERAVERQQGRSRVVTVTEAPRMEMKLGGMRMAEPTKAPQTRRVTLQQDPAMQMRGARMGMSPDATIAAHQMVSPRSNAPEDRSMRGGRHPAAPIPEPGVSR